MTIVIIILLCLCLLYIPAFMYKRYGAFVWFFHDYLGWHQSEESEEYFDGSEMHSRCKWCGKYITQDSQGNWI